MTSVRTSEAMTRDGFMIITFPCELAELMLAQAREHIRQSTGVAVADDADVEELIRAVLTLPDEAFVKKFKKPFRIFPDPIGGRVLDWVAGMTEFLGGRRAGINYISAAEQRETPALMETSYDLFWRCVCAAKPDFAPPHADLQVRET